MKTEMKFEHQKLNLRQINKLIQSQPHESIAVEEEELDLIAAYRVMKVSPFQNISPFFIKSIRLM